ncbi:hypothetical protein T484DRAFT_1970738, partial [Baffinella frigidus]
MTDGWWGTGARSAGPNVYPGVLVGVCVPPHHHQTYPPLCSPRPFPTTKPSNPRNGSLCVHRSWKKA